MDGGMCPRAHFDGLEKMEITALHQVVQRGDESSGDAWGAGDRLHWALRCELFSTSCRRCPCQSRHASSRDRSGPRETRRAHGARTPGPRDGEGRVCRGFWLLMGPGSGALPGIPRAGRAACLLRATPAALGATYAPDILFGKPFSVPGTCCHCQGPWGRRTRGTAVARRLSATRRRAGPTAGAGTWTRFVSDVLPAGGGRTRWIRAKQGDVPSLSCKENSPSFLGKSHIDLLAEPSRALSPEEDEPAAWTRSAELLEDEETRQLWLVSGEWGRWLTWTPFIFGFALPDGHDQYVNFTVARLLFCNVEFYKTLQTIASLGLVVQLEVGAWRYSYTEQKDYTWEQARNYCQTYFTDLVAIQNKREIEHLNQWLPFHRRYYWIGIRKLNGTWTWVGTRKALTKEAENWAEKEPNNKRSNQDCVEIYIKRQQEPGKWNDEPCSKMKRALCYQASCQPFPCSQRGECVETIGNYSCECQPGFYGRDCENVIVCPELNAPNWGELSCSHLHGNFTFGSTCAFSCQTGFVLTGPQSRECTAVGEWTGQSPRCEAIQCPALAAPAMGHAACSHLHGNFTFGSTCAFSCQTGFVLTGPQSRECTAVGELTGQSPRCEVHGNFTFGSTCAFSCQTGFVLTGPQSRECTAVGEWTGQSPRCEAIQCPALAAPAMGHAACSHLHGNFTFGSTCAFSCQTGFVLTGPQSRECTAVGEWTGQSPRCEAVVCPVLSAPNWGELSCSHLHGNFTFGSTCAFSCQTGFVLTGPQSRECTAVGEWTGQSPRCEAVSCPVLDAPSRGQLSCSHLHGNFTYSSTCAFSCEAGFVRMGAEVLRCAATGNWTRRPPVCAEDATSFLKEVLVYSGSTALVAVGIVLSGTLIALLVKRLSDREEKKKLLNPTSDLGSPGVFTNAAYDSNL
nr:PREDICTED: P-selectin-like [Struthio camelus australis]